MVRAEASAVLKDLVTGVGKGLAPFLKPLAGAWWLAQFDPHSDAAAAARQAFQAAFPGPKQREALAFCRQQVCWRACRPEPLGGLVSPSNQVCMLLPKQGASSQGTACMQLLQAEGVSLVYGNVWCTGMPTALSRLQRA